MSLTKHAGWFDFLKPKNISKAARNPYVIAAASPIIGAGVDAGIGQVKRMMQARGKVQAYKSMLDENPALRKKPAKDTQKLFNTLYNANPELAKDPLVASGWVHTQIEQQIPGVPHAGVVEGVSQLTKIRQQMRSPSTGRTPDLFQTLGREVGRLVPEAHRERMATRTKEFREAGDYSKAEADRLEERLNALQMPLSPSR